MAHLTTAGYTVPSAKQYIQDNVGYAEAKSIAENAPDLYIFLDNGYQYEGHAPCGCYECGSGEDAKMRLCHDGNLMPLCLDCWWYLYRN